MLIKIIVGVIAILLFISFLAWFDTRGGDE